MGQNPYTHSIVIKNVGALPTKNVRIGHTFLPDIHNIHPAINYEIHPIPGGGKEILIPILVPNEELTLSYLYFPPFTFQQINTYVKSDDGIATVLNMIPSPNITGWRIITFKILLFLGLTTAIFLLILVLYGVYCIIQMCGLSV